MVAKVDVGKFRSTPRQSCPRFKKRVRLFVKAVKVVSYPDTVKMIVHGRQNVFNLVINYWLVITPPVPYNRREPPELQSFCASAHSQSLARNR